MDEIHVHKTKKSICAHFAESPCIYSKRIQIPNVYTCIFFYYYFIYNAMVLVSIPKHSNKRGKTIYTAENVTKYAYNNYTY